jgi:hypothetical protein
VDEVQLQGELGAADVMFARRVEVELLQEIRLVPTTIAGSVGP